jgi:hypothetical protein
MIIHRYERLCQADAGAAQKQPQRYERMTLIRATVRFKDTPTKVVHPACAAQG